MRMGVIRKLPDVVANKIAAGEVIERPASVVKELVENSIDAGASWIEIQIEEGGKKLTRVVDDGCGMDSEDLRMAFERHATSKIRTSDDLFYIITKGFRGEALPSIGAVSECSVTSRQKGADRAHRIIVKGGKTAEPSEVGAPEGTSVEVRNLFFNVPARRKFLKSSNTELSHIVEAVTRISLSHPEVGFRLSSGKRRILELAPAPDKGERIRQLFGKELSGSLTRHEISEKGIHLELYLDPDSRPKPSSRWVRLYVNRRPVTDRLIYSTLREAYSELLPPGRFPIIFLFFDLDPRMVDVNVHPAKLEVRFQNPELIRKVVVKCIREGLGLEGKKEAVPASAERLVPERMKRPGTPPSKPAEVFPSALFDDFFSGQTPATARCLQVHNSYIIIETVEGIRIIDQHALHERVLYEEILERLKKARIERQRLLMPEIVELPVADAELLLESREELLKVGFELESFGQGTVAVQAVPKIVSDASISHLLEELVDSLREGRRGFDERIKTLSAFLACKGAVQSGQRLSELECRALVERLDSTPPICPHGRPISYLIPISEIEKGVHRK